MMNLDIIYEDDSFLVINKPCDLSYNGEGLHEELRKYTNSQVFGVHRLDKATSGVLIFAKNSVVASNLGNLFKLKKVTKKYIAISEMRPSKKQGLIKGDMKKGRGGNWALQRSLLNPAITRFESELLPTGLRKFRLSPLTGKTHQLRVALKSLGSVILGDERYGGQMSDRMYLHCQSMAFEYEGRQYLFECSPKVGLHW